MTMTQTEITEIVRLHKLWLLRDEKGKNADLRSANLRSADLHSADLSYADLSSANLRSADLSYADLSSADLSSANLRSADLSYADLSSADLSSANLRSANLSCANLSGADLRYADLRYANLSGADLSSADLRSAANVVSVTGIGSERRMTTYRADTDEIWCGCFKGTLAGFTRKVKETHKDNPEHLAHYLAAVAFFKAYEKNVKPVEKKQRRASA